MRRGRRKNLYRRERGSSEGPHDEAEIQRKTLRCGKNLAFSKDTCSQKERVPSKVTTRKVGVRLKRRRETSRRRLGWRSAWWGSTEKKEASRLLGLRGRHQYSDQRSNQNRAPCAASTAVGTEGEGGPNGQIVSIKRAVDGKGREAGISLMKNEKSTGPRTDLCGTPRRTGKNNFSDFEKPRKRAY